MSRVASISSGERKVETAARCRAARSSIPQPGTSICVSPRAVRARRIDSLAVISVESDARYEEPERCLQLFSCRTEAMPLFGRIDKCCGSSKAAAFVAMGLSLADISAAAVTWVVAEWMPVSLSISTKRTNIVT